MSLNASGVEDDGSRRGLDPADLEQSLATLRAMAEEARAAAALVRLLPGNRAGRRCAIVRVHRLCVPDVTYTDLRIAGESAKPIITKLFENGAGQNELRLGFDHARPADLPVDGSHRRLKQILSADITWSIGND